MTLPHTRLNTMKVIINYIIMVMSPFSAHAADLYLAPGGNDANPGTKDRPMATLERARDAIRELKKKGPLPQGVVTVYLRGGVYTLEQSFELSAEDSGDKDAPIVYTACPGEAVRLVGGKIVTGWKPVTDPAVLARLEAPARGKVLQADLKALGIIDFGGVAPGANRAELCFGDRTMKLARYPNDGWLRIAGVPQEGKLEFPGDFRRGTGPTRINGKIAGKHYGRFTYDGDRPARWKQTFDIWVNGYWVWDYAAQYHPVARLDTVKKEVWPNPPYHFYGYNQGGRFYFINVLEELDQPGEWYLDRQRGLIYFWPPSSIDWDEAIFPLLGEPMMRMEKVRNVQVRGIVMECARGGAVDIRGGEQVTIAGCTLRNLGSTAIDIMGGSRHRVQDCDLYELGEGGINIEGGDRTTLIPARHVVENCDIHHIDRVIGVTANPAIKLIGVGCRVSHCAIHDVPHIGLYYEGNDHTIEYCEFARTGYDAGDTGAINTAKDWTYCGNTIRYCYFHDIHSPPRVHIGSMTVYLDLPCGSLHLYGNIFVDNQRAFFTNSGRDCLIENNIFVNCDPSIHFNSWRDPSMFRDDAPWPLTQRLRAMNISLPPYSLRYPQLLRIFKDGDPAIPTGNVVRRNISCGGKFLTLQPLVDLGDVRVEQNLIADPLVFTGSPTGSGKSAEYRSDNTTITAILVKAGNVITHDPGFVDAGRGDFRIKPDSPALKLGFEPIPMDKIGLQIGGDRKMLPLPAPGIQPHQGQFIGETQVSMTQAARGPKGIIYYTLDGSEPTEASPSYTSPLRLTRTATVKAATFGKSGAAMMSSGAVVATFDIVREVYLSDLAGLDPVAYGGVKRDCNFKGGAIKLAGREYAKGLMLCPQKTGPQGLGHVTYKLEGGLQNARRLHAVVGIEDAMRGKNVGSACFIVEALRQGKWARVFESPVLRPGQLREVNVDLSGSDQIRLLTTDGGDNIFGDHAVWADARLQ